MQFPSIHTNSSTSLPSFSKAKAAKLKAESSFSEAAKQLAAAKEASQLPAQIPPDALPIQLNEKPAEEGFIGQAASASSSTTAEEDKASYTPDEHRYGRKRPPLPITFGFGIRRYTTLPLAMRFSLVAGQAPPSPQEAIQATLNLAATNEVAYAKGSQVNLYL